MVCMVDTLEVNVAYKTIFKNFNDIKKCDIILNDSNSLILLLTQYCNSRELVFKWLFEGINL